MIIKLQQYLSMATATILGILISAVVTSVLYLPIVAYENIKILHILIRDNFIASCIIYGVLHYVVFALGLLLPKLTPEFIMMKFIHLVAYSVLFSFLVTCLTGVLTYIAVVKQDDWLISKVGVISLFIPVVVYAVLQLLIRHNNFADLAIKRVFHIWRKDVQ